MKIQSTVEAVIKKVLWTSGATAQNQRLLAEAIAQELAKTLVPMDYAKDSNEKAWAVAKSLQAQVQILESEMGTLAQGASAVVAQDALRCLQTHREQTTGVTAEESPAGVAMAYTVLLADPEDVELITELGGDLMTGFHRVAQMIRGQVIGNAVETGIDPALPH